MSEAAQSLKQSEHVPVNAIVAMVRVAQIERSAEFYKLLGFEIGNYVPRAENCPMHWAWLHQPNAANWKTGANLMLVRGDRVPDGEEPNALFYLYASDLTAVRERLIAAGVKVGEIEYPEYLPKGEFKTSDPDGWMLMIAQSYEQSP